MDACSLRSYINTSAISKERVSESGGAAAGESNFFPGVEVVLQERSI